jgi:hypothetical protein
MDTIIFEITWSGSQDARLYYLIDNDHVVTTTSTLAPHTESVTVGRGHVRVKYQIEHAPAHRIEWSLMFPGKTLSDLETSASVNGGEKQTKSAADDQKQHWVGALDA